jgi:hypothetical protein
MDVGKGKMETINFEAEEMMEDYLTIYIVESFLEKST